MSKILVYDDSPDRMKQWESELEKIIPKGWKVVSMQNQEFKEGLEALFSRRRQARSGPVETGDKAEELFDSVDIAIIDYDLIDTDLKLDLTGEDVAYFLRCYSTCGYIVAVNQFRATRTFDLTMDGHLDKFADLHISESDLSSPGLWNRRWTGFRPSNWPYLPDAPQLYEEQIEEVKGSLNSSIIDFFKFPDSAVIADSLASFLDVPGENFTGVTFSDFVRESTNGLKPKDEQPNEMMIARIAAARIHKWLEHGILPLQNVLVDAPHIALRFPSLFTGEWNSVEDWNQLTNSGREIPLNQLLIKRHQFERESWLSRPVWFWRDMQNNRQIKEVNEPWELNSPPFVFCEDTSCFVLEEKATEFDTGQPSSYSLRHIEKRDEAAYVPLRQLFT